MSRAEQGKTLAIASLAFSGAAAGTSFSSGGMTLAAGIATAIGLGVALLGFVYARKSEDQAAVLRKREESDKEERARQEREVERKERLAKEAKEHDDFLNETIHCEDLSCGFPHRTYPRRQLWRLHPTFGGKSVCRECFKCRTKHYPVEGRDKRAYE